MPPPPPPENHTAEVHGQAASNVNNQINQQTNLQGEQDASAKVRAYKACII